MKYLFHIDINKFYFNVKNKYYGKIYNFYKNFKRRIQNIKQL
jgi:hypothetical protein